jgi:hypothetical protein
VWFALVRVFILKKFGRAGRWCGWLRLGAVPVWFGMEFYFGAVSRGVAGIGTVGYGRVLHGKVSRDEVL